MPTTSRRSTSGPMRRRDGRPRGLGSGGAVAEGRRAGDPRRLQWPRARPELGRDKLLLQPAPGARAWRLLLHAQGRRWRERPGVRARPSGRVPFVLRRHTEHIRPDLRPAADPTEQGRRGRRYLAVRRARPANAAPCLRLDGVAFHSQPYCAHLHRAATAARRSVPEGERDLRSSASSMTCGMSHVGLDPRRPAKAAGLFTRLRVAG